MSDISAKCVRMEILSRDTALLLVWGGYVGYETMKSSACLFEIKMGNLNFQSSKNVKKNKSFKRNSKNMK